MLWVLDKYKSIDKSELICSLGYNTLTNYEYYKKQNVS